MRGRKITQYIGARNKEENYQVTYKRKRKILEIRTEQSKNIMQNAMGQATPVTMIIQGL